MQQRPESSTRRSRATFLVVAALVLLVPHLARGSGQDPVYFRPPANLSNSPTVSQLPPSSPRSLALDPSGRAFLVWVEVVPHTKGTALELALCQYFAGTGWDSTITAVGRWEGANSTDPACVVDRDQVLHLVWVDEGSGQRQVVGTRFNLRTGALSAMAAISAPPGVPADPALAAAVDGSVHVLWSETRDGTASLRHRRWTAAGWDSITSVTADLGPSASSPDIACDPRGNLHAAWLRTRHSPGANDTIAVIYAIRSPDGRWSRAEEVRGPVADWSPGPPIVAVAGDEIWVLWSERNGKSSRIELRRTRGDGWSVIRSPSHSRFAGDPSVAIDGGGALNLVWLDGPDMDHASSVAYSRLAPGDTAFAPPRVLTASSEGPFANPMMASDRSGRVASAWVDTGTGRGDIICRNGVVGFALPAGPRHTVHR